MKHPDDKQVRDCEAYAAGVQTERAATLMYLEQRLDEYGPEWRKALSAAIADIRAEEHVAVLERVRRGTAVLRAPAVTVRPHFFLYEHRGVFWCRFRLGIKFHRLNTQQRDKGSAERVAQRMYADALAAAKSVK